MNTQETHQCYHCGDPCQPTNIEAYDKHFCCHGCKTVFEIFSENDLTCYYDFENAPGKTPPELEGKYDFLNQDDIVEKLVDFNDGDTQIINLYIPHIHCSSCIWILENLNKLNPHISNSQVNFPKKTVQIQYNCTKTNLKEVVNLLTSIGYEPYISLEDMDKPDSKIDRSLTYKIGIAGFAFGNVMFLSFPEYFEVSEFWLDQYKPVFRWLMFAFSLPVVFYAAQDYFKSAFSILKTKQLNIDIPIALGIATLFIRSTVEISFNLGSGFFDSLTGLVFFLLLGKFVQQKTYNYLSFERDYKSYFPIAVTKIENESETNIKVSEIKAGDKLLIRNAELIPVDGILMNGEAHIDYSFVTGEEKPVHKTSGDKIFAGGKQIGSSIEMTAEKSVEQSYLTQLWSNEAFTKQKPEHYHTLLDKISKHFTIGVLGIASISTLIWLFINPSLALNVFTAVLIIACPCAIALATPFTMGNLLRLFGQKGFYLKDIKSLEQLTDINQIIFDKTGTLTQNEQAEITYEGEAITDEDRNLLKNTLRNSNHPLSRQLYHFLQSQDIMTVEDYEEHLGQGIEAKINDQNVKLGSSTFVNAPQQYENFETAVHYKNNEQYRGKFVFKTTYRQGVQDLFHQLKNDYQLAVLSGDNKGEKEFLERFLPSKTPLYFNQKPEDKLNYIKTQQDKHQKVMMIGDGLNDAGALKQSDLGIALSENINVFSPACDAILDAKHLSLLPKFIHAAHRGIKTIKISFVLSFLYNIIGLYFAVTGQLEPVIAAILMPLSSISIVGFTTVMTHFIGKKIKS
ncbi:heavy metal translocating P-type ATPase [Flavobacteriaceae bacterium 14752]|uniref:heavy metal translocating P-type ATPase n=1 Tax=Mesohalobacter salilacus TaxID=2491711 RepID=UPI000F643B50|nr:HAD family hydrolase [Flavobacteriaceae bacterium 14752]